jgi:DNA processing protein
MAPGVGSVHFIRLLARFHTPTEVLKASEAALCEVVGPKLAQRIAQYSDVAAVDAQERLMDSVNATLITLEDPAYPVRLAEIYDPPLALFARGALLERDEASVAIVGTRRASPYGAHMAEKFGRDLAARGVTVVSGMALGVDSAAHRGAIDAGGRTIAVLGCGVDVAYPPQNAELAREIEKSGCVISQFLMGVKPSPGHFPYRNRIISGLSLGTLVVEAPKESGALITARQAAEQGREVFAVPGQVGSRNSEGPHSLIREGAKLAETAEDILVELELPSSIRHSAPTVQTTSIESVASREETSREPISARSKQPAPANISANVSPLEKDILSVLSPNGSFVDEIAAACRIPISEALSSLTLLELKGLVRQFSGKRFSPA